LLHFLDFLLQLLGGLLADLHRFTLEFSGTPLRPPHGRQNLLIVTSMSFDRTAEIEHNVAVQNWADSRPPQPDMSRHPLFLSERICAKP